MVRIGVMEIWAGARFWSRGYMYVTPQVEKKKAFVIFIRQFHQQEITYLLCPFIGVQSHMVRIIVIIRLLLSRACLVALVAGCSTLPKNKA